MKSPFAIKSAAENHLAANSNDSLYLLIDHAGMPGLYRKLEKSSASWASLFEETRESGALSVAPLLILLGCNSSLQINRLLFQWISEQAPNSSAVIMLASHLSIKELKDRLALRLDVKISQDMDAILRFFDPRIFQQLVRILTSDQLAKLCGPAKTWWYVDRTGELVRIEREFQEVDKDCYSLDLSEEQEFSLVSMSEPDQIMHILRMAMPQVEPLISGSSYQIIVDSIHAAANLKLDAISDLALYAAMVILRGVEFEELPYWRDVLPDVRAGKISFANAVANSKDIVGED